jgi:hypothetical protein
MPSSPSPAVPCARPGSHAAGVHAIAFLALGLAGCGTVAPPPHAPPPAPAPVAPAMPAPAAPPAPPAPLPKATEPPPSAAPNPIDVMTAVDTMTQHLLAAHERLRELGTADLAREIARLGTATDPPARIELAIALAHTRSSGDLARAINLLEPLARPAAAGTDAVAPLQGAAVPWLPFARLLHARLSEQRRLEEQLDRQSQQLREQQRRLEQLGAQLDALRAIERSLNTRPAVPVPAPPRP